MHPNQLLVLLTIRHLQPTSINRVVVQLDWPRSNVVYRLYGDYNYDKPGLIANGLVAVNRGQMGTMRLTEAGQAAIAGYALIREGGRYRVGKSIVSPMIGAFLILPGGISYE